MEAQKVDRFEAVADDGRIFHVTAWQELEPQRFGRTRVRVVPTIQNLVTDEGYFVRRTPDGRFELPELGIRVTRVNAHAQASTSEN